MQAIIDKYNPQILQESPRYIWFVKDEQQNDIFHCDYKDNVLVIRMKNIYGAIVFNKTVADNKVQESIDFCLRYLSDYNSLGL